MRILIHRQATGMPYDILLQDGMIKQFHPEESYDLRVGYREDRYSGESLLEIYGHESRSLVPEEYTRSFKECHYTGYVPWSRVIPSSIYKPLLKEFVGELAEVSVELEESEYPGFFSETNELFQLLKPCYIDTQLCKSLLSESDNHVLSSFLKMSRDGMLPLPQYSRSGTKTGRLVVKEGPQILTLKKEHRAVLRPRSPKNKLYEIDFTSLEPRVALNLAKVQTQGDVYTSFAESSNMDVSRDIAKLAVLCALYGAGKYRLESVLSKESSSISAARLINSVKEYFQVKPLKEMLKDQASEGVIKNCFGRPIQVDDERDSILLNNFLQSSAVDVALAGFLDFCKLMNGSIRPLFIIHDALVFEADPKNLTPILEYVSNGYEATGLGLFPLKITELNAHE